MESFWFLLVLWTSCNELFNTFLVSGDVCDEVVFHSSMFKPAAFLSKLTSVKMCKHLRGVNAFVFFLMCNLKANPSCVPLGEMLDIDDLGPARLLQRKSAVWIWSVVATRQTMCGLDTMKLMTEQCLLWARFSLVTRQITKRTSWISQKGTGHARACQQSCRKGNNNSNSNDVVNEVFLRRVSVPAVPLLKTSYLHLESYFKRSDVQFCVKECAKS